MKLLLLCTSVILMAIAWFCITPTIGADGSVEEDEPSTDRREIRPGADPTGDEFADLVKLAGDGAGCSNNPTTLPHDTNGLRILEEHLWESHSNWLRMSVGAGVFSRAYPIPVFRDSAFSSLKDISDKKSDDRRKVLEKALEGTKIAKTIQASAVQFPEMPNKICFVGFLTHAGSYFLRSSKALKEVEEWVSAEGQKGTLFRTRGYALPYDTLEKKPLENTAAKEPSDSSGLQLRYEYSGVEWFWQPQSLGPANLAALEYGHPPLRANIESGLGESGYMLVDRRPVEVRLLSTDRESPVGHRDTSLLVSAYWWRFGDFLGVSEGLAHCRVLWMLPQTRFYLGSLLCVVEKVDSEGVTLSVKPLTTENILPWKADKE